MASGFLLLRNPWRHAWKVAQVGIVSQALFAAKELGLAQRHESSHADYAFFHSFYINPEIELSMAVCAGCLLFFHDELNISRLKAVELIRLQAARWGLLRLSGYFYSDLDNWAIKLSQTRNDYRKQ